MAALAVRFALLAVRSPGCGYFGRMLRRAWLALQSRRYLRSVFRGEDPAFECSRHFGSGFGRPRLTILLGQAHSGARFGRALPSERGIHPPLTEEINGHLGGPAIREDFLAKDRYSGPEPGSGVRETEPLAIKLDKLRAATVQNLGPSVGPSTVAGFISAAVVNSVDLHP